MADRVLQVRKALVARLRSQITAVSNRVYDRVPEAATFPYLQIGPATAVPFDAVGLRGQETAITVHAWSRKPGSVECAQLLAAMNAALHWYQLPLDAGGTVLCRVVNRRDMADPDGITTHGMLDLTIITDG